VKRVILHPALQLYSKVIITYHQRTRYPMLLR